MNLKQISVGFDIADVQQILAIALDENPEEALSFIRGNLVKKIEKALQRHCVPVFETCYGPGQKEQFGR